MTAANFEQCLRWLLESEGGNDDDPLDHGGRTSRGITQREYDAYRDREDLPRGDVWKATDAEVKQIYHDSYWKPYCDDLPTGIDYLFFDMSVLQGLHKAVQILQRGLGVKDDGHIGIVTRTALSEQSTIDRLNLISRITQKRIRFFQSLRQPRFTKGWLHRAHSVENLALALYRGTSPI